MISKIFNLKFTLFLIVLFSSLFIYNYLVVSKPEAIPNKGVEKNIYVKAKSFQRRNYYPTSEAYGKIVSSRKGDLRFGVSGKIEFVAAELLNGSIVKNNQVLAKLNQKRYNLEIEKLSVEYEELEKQLSIRQKQVNRYKSMLTKKVISQSTYDNELILLSKNKADFIKTKIFLEKAKEDLSDTVLKSKFNGRLSDVKISKGQFINNSEKIADIFSTDNLELEFIVSSEIYTHSKYLIDKKVKIIWKSGQRKLREITAVIDRVDGKILEEEGGVRLYAKLFNSDNKNQFIPIGTFVSVIYPEGEFKNIFKLPETSLYDDKIYVVKNNITKLTKTKVNLQRLEKKSTELRGKSNRKVHNHMAKSYNKTHQKWTRTVIFLTWYRHFQM